MDKNTNLQLSEGALFDLSCVNITIICDDLPAATSNIICSQGECLTPNQNIVVSADQGTSIL
jgi:hypothetical protein